MGSRLNMCDKHQLFVYLIQTDISCFQEFRFGGLLEKCCVMSKLSFCHNVNKKEITLLSSLKENPICLFPTTFSNL